MCGPRQRPHFAPSQVAERSGLGLPGSRVSCLHFACADGPDRETSGSRETPATQTVPTGPPSGPGRRGAPHRGGAARPGLCAPACVHMSHGARSPAIPGSAPCSACSGRVPPSDTLTPPLARGRRVAVLTHAGGACRSLSLQPGRPARWSPHRQPNPTPAADRWPGHGQCCPSRRDTEDAEAPATPRPQSGGDSALGALGRHLVGHYSAPFL